MPKEKNYNPVQAQRKADKAKEIKKGKWKKEDKEIFGFDPQAKRYANNNLALHRQGAAAGKAK